MSGNAVESGDTFSCDLQVRWADFDQLRHVNNTKYIEYAQEARVLFMRGYLTDENHPAPVLVVRRLDVDFVRPLLRDSDKVRVDITIGRVGTTSVVMHHRMYDAFGANVCNIEAVMVALDHRTSQPQAIGDGHRGMLTRFTREG